MKKQLNIYLFFRWTFVCVGLWGCWHESVEDVSSSKLIGYSGDSLVVFIEEKTEETCLAKPLGDDCSTRELGTRIVVNNFYTEENVWKSSKIKDKYVTNVYDLIDDTTVIELDKKEGRFHKWTLGKGSEDLGYFEWSGCKLLEKIGSIRPWGDGYWRLIGSSESCGYAIVDVEKKKITGYENLENFAKGCSDLWDHEGVKYCVGAVKKDTVMSYYERFLAGAMIKNSGGISDTLWNDQIEGAALNSYHAVIFKNSFVCYLNNYYKIDYNKVKMVFDH
ncbi:hypothetical protein [Fibrobacter intestinalis]|uniref:Uncharacterized protein n=1 Tax=Fibrobacter intestinalis TaxID=28122 RepID=A0A1T4RM78_9BACT|nr:MULTISPECIES: hypothetical protein [Fibrobacter]PBC72749.1 hypothetical protein BGW94_0327 [Fibrobacter sp. NR9]SKA17094.1 hypothetical protein SAMN02745108_02771 [Fibrobacter intestinalis]